MPATENVEHKTAGERVGDPTETFTAADIAVIEASNLLPPEGNENLGRRIFTILSEILADKEALGLTKKWNKHYQWTKNEYWRQRQVQGSDLISANLLYAHRERNVSLLTDQNPTFNVVALRGQNDSEDELEATKKRTNAQQQIPSETLEGDELEIHQKLHRTADFWWRDTEQQTVLETSVSEAETYSCVIEKVSFDSTLDHGRGEVKAETIAPYWFGVFPVNAMKSQEAEANVHFKLMTIREAKRTWPKVAEFIKSDEDVLKNINDERRDVDPAKSEGQKYYSIFSNIVKTVQNLVGGKRGELSSEDGYTVVTEMWVKDYTLNKDTGESKYPGNIRCVTSCNGGEVILSDRPNPSITTDKGRKTEDLKNSYLWDKFPFTLTPSIWDPGYIWGMSDFEQLKGLQKELNKTLSQIAMIQEKTARLKLKNPRNSGVTNEELDNNPSIINPSNAQAGEGIGYLNPPTFPFDLFKGAELYKDFLFAVSGSFLLEQAQGPGRDVIAFKAIAALLEQANIMLKRKVRNYGKMVRERGRMYLSLVLNFYTNDRWITYTDNGVEKGFKINAQDIKIPMKLLVISGSMMPISKIQEREEAIILFKAGAIDNEELLKRHDWPDWKQVVRRMQAGPFGVFLDKLAAMGIPPELLTVFKAISEMDQKNFVKSMKDGELPDFKQFLLLMAEQAQSAENQPQETSPEDRVTQADALLKIAEAELKEAQADKTVAETDKIQADTDKILAETELTEAKTKSEYVDQQIGMEGVEFDAEKLKAERAEQVENIRQTEHSEVMEEATVEADIEHKAADALAKAKGAEGNGGGGGDKSSVKSKDQKGQGPHRERGLRSNNEDI